jgi:uncharacterized protein YdhG (YjbR/CyaY superfamily)
MTEAETTEAQQHDDYLAGLPAEQRTALDTVAGQILAAAPDAQKGFSYGAPAFRVGGRPVAGLAAAKAHLSYLTFSPQVIADHADELAPWAPTKGAIKFTPEHPLPGQLVASLVRARRSEIER